jgi:cation diffusion facilitator CzcD-associated flavoprotein CzcO
VRTLEYGQRIAVVGGVTTVRIATELATVARVTLSTRSPL